MEQFGFFTSVNESIRKLANGAEKTQAWDFICECPDPTCHSSVSLTLIQFDKCRAASPPVPVLAPEHDGERASRTAHSRRPRPRMKSHTSTTKATTETSAAARHGDSARRANA